MTKRVNGYAQFTLTTFIRQWISMSHNRSSINDIVSVECTFAEAPCGCFFDMHVLGGSTEDVFGLLVIFVQEKDDPVHR